MKIGISIWMFVKNTGGLYRHTEDLALELKKLGHDVVIITRFSSFLPKGNEYACLNEFSESVTRDEIEIRHIRLNGKLSFLNKILVKLHHTKYLSFSAIWFYDLLSRKSACECFSDREIIHHIGQSTALVGFSAQRTAKRIGVPFVVQPTVHPGQCGDSELDLKLFRSADALFVHTQFERSYFENTFHNTLPPIKVVGNGISDRSDGSAERFRNANHIRDPFVLYVGRKDRDKGFHLVYGAWLLAREKFPGLKLVAAGPSNLDKEHDINPIEGYVDLGFCDEQQKHDALAACTCLCVPSEGESFGLIFMEAGRYRKPVIARRLPVLLELIGEDGAVLVGSNVGFNRVDVQADEIAEQIIHIVSNPSAYTDHGNTLYLRSSSFVWHNTALRFDKSYKSLLEIYSRK